MLLLAAVLGLWRGLLAALPRPVMTRLDAWAHHRAVERAERRRRLAAPRG